MSLMNTLVFSVFILTWLNPLSSIGASSGSLPPAFAISGRLQTTGEPSFPKNCRAKVRLTIQKGSQQFQYKIHAKTDESGHPSYQISRLKEDGISWHELDQYARGDKTCWSNLKISNKGIQVTKLPECNCEPTTCESSWEMAR